MSGTATGPGLDATTSPTAPAVPARTSRKPVGGAFTALPAELSRVLRLASGKATGSPVFPFVGLEAVPFPNGGGRLEFLYANKAHSLSTRIAWNGLVGAVEPVVCATEDVNRITDYIDSRLFGTEAPLRFAFDAESGRIVVSNGARVVRVRAVAPDAVPVYTELPDPFGIAEGGHHIAANPKTRPIPEAALKWDAWVQSGYVVVTIPRTSLDAVLDAAATLVAHEYGGTRLRFEVNGSDLKIVCADPKAGQSEEVRFDSVEGADTHGSPHDSFLLHYRTVAPLLEALRAVKTDRVYLVHWPGDERRKAGEGKGAETTVNVAAGEDAPDGSPLLRVTQMLALEKESRKPAA